MDDIRIYIRAGVDCFPDKYLEHRICHPELAEQFPPVLYTDFPNALPSVVVGPGFRVSVPKITRTNGCLEATIRIDATRANKIKLATGEKVDTIQNSPCTLCVILGNSRTEIAFPFPTQNSVSRLRIARKSGWIETVAPFIMSPTASSFNFAKLPIIKEATALYYSWNLPRLSPKLLPQLNLLTTNDLSWINTNVSSSFSARERTLREDHLKDLTTGDVFVDMKENIFSLFAMCSGAGCFPNSNVVTVQKVFFLDVNTVGVMSIIFVTGLRLDLNDCTLVVGSYVLPLTPELVSIFANELSLLREKEGLF
jgi:hypothetical protein